MPVGHHVQQLDNTKSNIRRAAINALAVLDATDQVSKIAELLTDPDSSVQYAAVNALVAFDAKDQINAIAELLTIQHSNSQLLTTAISALATLDAKEQVHAIAGYLTYPIINVSQAAIQALVTLDAKDQISAIVKLLKGRKERNSRVQRSVAKALVMFDAKDQISTISDLLTDSDRHIQLGAIKALALLNAKEEVSAIIKLLIDTLIIIDSKSDREIFNEYLTHSGLEIQVRDTAISALVTLKVKNQISGIIRLLKNTGSSRLRVAAIKILAKLDAKNVIPAIANLLTDPVSDVRRAAIEALVTLKAKDQISSIVKLLTDRNYRVQLSAIEAIAMFDAKDQISTITKFLTSSNDSVLRAGAIRALAKLNAKDQISIIAEHLLDSDSYVRYSAINALATLNEKKQKSAIAKLLKDLDSDVRRAAIQALVVFKAKDQGSEIAKLLSDSDSDVRDEAIEALVTLDAKGQSNLIAKLLMNSDQFVQSNAIKALVALEAKDQISAIKKLITDQNSSVRRTAIKAMARLEAKDEAVAIAKLLTEQDSDVLDTVIEALVTFGPFSFKNSAYVQILELSYYDSKEFAKFLFVAHLLGAGKHENEIAITWLGSLGQPFWVETKIDSKEGNEILNVFNKIWELTKKNSSFREDVANKSAKLVSNSSWEVDDIPILTLLEDKLRKDGYSIQADFIQKKIDFLKANEWISLGGKIWFVHGLFWLILITAYPRFRMIQAVFFWNPLVRRIIGFGYVGFLLTWVPYLRTKLFAPFKLSLNADAMLDEFDESTYFAKYCVKLLPHGQSEQIRKIFRAVKGQIILQGDSGRGKTMLLRVLTLHSSHIVVFLPAANCAQSVMYAIQKKLHGLAKDEKFLKKLIYAGAIDVYIDGLNEVSPETRAKISGFAEEYSNANIIMTTQPMEWSFPTTARSYEIEPLNPDQIEAFLISRKIILAADAPVLGDSYETSCRNYLASYFEQAEEMIKVTQKVLSNPMDLTTVAHVLSLGKNPDLFNLQQQSYQIMDFFIVQTFLGKDNDKPQKHLGDPRFRGVYFMLATLMPLDDAKILREQLINFAVDTKDHTVSDSFIEIVRFRKES